MPLAFSLYLDLIRFLAAVVVVLHHTWPLLFPAHALPWPGHQAVVVFFVLSGLVIAHAAARPGGDLRAYARARARRIGAVAYPAMLLSALVGALLPSSLHIPAAPTPGGIADIAQRLALNATFLAQSAWFDRPPPANLPFWSLDYEVWYYTIFGLWTWLEGRRRIGATALALFLAGPRILLLMPVWLMGVAVYRRAPRLSRPLALGLFVATGLAALAFVLGDAGIAIRTAMVVRWPAAMALLHGSNQFVGDTLLGLIVSAHFGAAANLTDSLAPLVRWERAIRAASSVSFSIYLYHMPLFALMFGVLGWRGAWLYGPLAAGIIGLASRPEQRLAKAGATCRRSSHAGAPRVAMTGTRA